MLKKHFEMEDKGETQHALPENWEDVARNAADLPMLLSSFDEGKYRGGMVWPKHVKRLQKEFGIRHIVSLMEGDWLNDFYDDPNLVIHQFRFRKRNDMTPDMALEFVDLLSVLQEPTIVHCYKGVTRTGMGVAAHQIVNRQKTPLMALLEYVLKSEYHCSGLVNLSTCREILGYKDLVDEPLAVSVNDMDLVVNTAAINRDIRLLEKKGQVGGYKGGVYMAPRPNIHGLLTCFRDNRGYDAAEIASVCMGSCPHPKQNNPVADDSEHLDDCLHYLFDAFSLDGQTRYVDVK
jgi:hypothetical protein